MYNRNLLTPVRYARVGGFDYPSTALRTGFRIHSELATPNLKVCLTQVLNRKFLTLNP